MHSLLQNLNISGKIEGSLMVTSGNSILKKQFFKKRKFGQVALDKDNLSWHINNLLNQHIENE